MEAETKKKILTAIAAIGSGVIIAAFTQLVSLTEEKEISKLETAVIKWEDIKRINRDNVTAKSRGRIEIEGADIFIRKE